MLGGCFTSLLVQKGQVYRQEEQEREEILDFTMNTLVASNP